MTEMLQLQPYLAEWRERGFDVLLITLADKTTAIAYLEAQGLVGLPVLHDPAQAMIKAYHVSGVPTSIIVNGEGVVQEVKVGWGGGSLDSLKALVDRLCPE